VAQTDATQPPPAAGRITALAVGPRMAALRAGTCRATGAGSPDRKHLARRLTIDLAMAKLPTWANSRPWAGWMQQGLVAWGYRANAARDIFEFRRGKHRGWAFGDPETIGPVPPNNSLRLPL